MTDRRILHISVAVCLTAFALLMVEILLIRVLDVILLPNFGYAVITLAMFASGLAGVYATVRPLSSDAGIRTHVAALSLLFGITVVLLRPALNAAPAVYNQLPSGLLKQLSGAAMMYLVLVVPFFISGVILAYVFSAFPGRIRRLYFWDLVGAGAGCVAILPFLRSLGPGGLMFWAAAASVVASALFAGRRAWSAACVGLASVMFVIPLLKADGYFEFRMHTDKRGVRSAQQAGRIEFSEWGPISKIDVISGSAPQSDGTWGPKLVAYDGGSQTSTLFSFDQDYDRLRQEVLDPAGDFTRHFWQRGVLASHYLKRDTGADVLIMGSAAGQETKAALLFNARSVEGVELVDTVVRIARERYGPFIGRIFEDPRVRNRVGEGRSYLRATDEKYDILQIFSNHTSSNVASGSGATTPVYLETVEAYREYFSHLEPDGILHVNHHFYPRIITTAARAWKEMGRSGFQRRAIVFERPGGDTLPTILFKSSPWTEPEVAELQAFFSVPAGDPALPRLVVNPLRPDATFLPPELFSGSLSDELLKRVEYRIQPSTDDWPYFNNIQKGFTRVELDPARLLDESMAQAINGRLALPLGEYSILTVIGLVGVVLSGAILFLPLRLSVAGRAPWTAKYVSLAYFSCLGSGFIIIELVLIQIFMKPIGFPLYTFCVVICTMLAGAGCGSMAADWLAISPVRRWMIPFAGILVSGGTLLWIYPSAFDVLLAAPAAARMLASVLMILPLAFFLGMPFPLGILSLERQPRGSVAWAWGMNALFTVLGGVGAGASSLFVGFRLTFFMALGVYLLAFVLFARLRITCTRVDARTADAPALVGAA